jgi:hypothetical protein
VERYTQARWRSQVQNGQIPGHMLAEITDPTDWDADLNGPAQLHPEATWNYMRMRTDARADGVVLTISYSYRTLAKQREKYADYLAGGNLAAVPGTSNHGWALALDMGIPPYPAANHSASFRWLKANAARYGFHNNDAPSEPWHWDYEGGHPIDEEGEDVTTDEMIAGWKAFMDGKPEPPEAGHKRAGWNMARQATTQPKPDAHDHPSGDHKHIVTGEAV